MPAGQVFVGAADNDPVSWLGGEDGLFPGTWDDSLGLGADPAQHDFGAINFAVDNGQEFHGAGIVTTGFMENHTNYFDDPDPARGHTNDALVNMANVVSGNTDAVVDTGGRTQEAHDYLYDWVGGEVQHHVVQPVVDTYNDVRDGVVETYEGVRDGVVRDLRGRARRRRRRGRRGPGRLGRPVAGPVAVTARLGRMRTAAHDPVDRGPARRHVACSSSHGWRRGVRPGTGRSRSSTRSPRPSRCVEQALGATKVTIGGGWSSCPGGVGHVYSGGGTITAPEGDTDAQLEAVRTALTDAGFEDGTQVEGHVSVSRDEVGLDFAPSAARGPGAWSVSFKGPCKRYGGDDEQYVQDQNLEGERTLLP